MIELQRSIEFVTMLFSEAKKERNQKQNAYPCMDYSPLPLPIKDSGFRLYEEKKFYER